MPGRGARSEWLRGALAALAAAWIVGCADAESRTSPKGTEPPGPDTAATAELLGLLSGSDPRPPATTAPDSPLWPQVAYLRAEADLAAGDRRRALVGFRVLARWGVSTGPVRERELGGSSLAAVAFWRWVALLRAGGAAAAGEVRQAAAIERQLRESRLARGIYRYGFLDALPQLEEETLMELALLSWRGGALDQARRLVPEALKLSSVTELAPEEQAMLDALVASGDLLEPQVTELRARRLEELRRHEEAIELWRELIRTGDRRQRDRARLQVASIRARLFDAERQELDRLLTQVVEGSQFQDEALYRRASVWGREGKGQDLRRFTDDLTRILENGIGSKWDNDALFRLASYHQELYLRAGSPAELEHALDLYRRLRSAGGENAWLDSAHFQPAMLLYTRGSAGDDHRAFELLRALGRRRPEGPLRRTALFWSARIFEERNRDSETAKQTFRGLITEQPYDYYALRARMHLEHGPAAAGRLWPGPEVRKQFAADYRRHPPFTELSGSSPYHRRLDAAIESGLYRTLLEHRQTLRARTPGVRIQELSLDELDRSGDLIPLVLLLALRQDARAATALGGAPQNVLEVHAAVALRAGDLPLALSLARDSGPTQDRPDRDPRFLHSAYPPAFVDVFRDAAEAEQIPPELLYALARRESLFDPAAISTFSARGLFQFIPSTFEALDERWNLLATAGLEDRDRYLFDARLNARLGARWLADELIHRQNCVLLRLANLECSAANRADPRKALVTSTDWFDANADTPVQRVVLLALMEHSRGYTAVRSWLDRWCNQARDRDLEYVIETAGAAETRVLVRGVVTDASIAASIDLFPRPRRAGRTPDG